MMPKLASGSTDASRSSAGPLMLALLILSAAPRPIEAASPSAGRAADTTLARDSVRCRTNADVEACYDAIRWNPGDPALLVALGDALVRAHRLQDADRNYRRALALAPNMRGVAAKISEVEARLSSKRAVRVPGRPYSNAAPEGQSH